jgi:hypothetical protein
VVLHMASRGMISGKLPARAPMARTIDQRLLACYRYAWAVQDIAAYDERVLLLPTLGEELRSAAIDGFMEHFEPGNIVGLASATRWHSGQGRHRVPPAGRPAGMPPAAARTSSR